MVNGEKDPIVWPIPQEMKIAGKGLALGKELRIGVKGDELWLREEARRAAEVIRLRIADCGLRIEREGNASATVRSRAGQALLLTISSMRTPPRGVKAVNKAEGYALSVGAKGIHIAGYDPRGVYYGAQTVARLIESSRREGSDSLPGASVRDWPRFAMRGAHLYLPPRYHFDYFERFLDFLAKYKMNLIFLEIGGGMEYEKHPEINESWRRFIRDAYAYNFESDRFKSSQRGPERRHTPVGPNGVPSSRFFSKDSVHPELAGGDCLTKAEIRRLIAMCRERHIEIIPEVQSLSHSYYLCMAHPDIAERAPEDDPWPDTYCISNPKSHQLLFDVMGEVIEMFKPRIIHIGRDELENFQECPKCKKRSAHELIAEDITEIRNFLASRGVRTMMWGDTLMHFKDRRGNWQGGNYKEMFDAFTNRLWVRPATYKAVDMIPKDVLMCDWFWGLDLNSERYFHKHGFEVCYGNFSPLSFDDWEKRADVKYVHGAEFSSWCEVAPYAFGHNRVHYNGFPAADMLWRGKQMARPQVRALTARRMTEEIDIMAAQRRWLVMPDKGKATPVNISVAATVVPDWLHGRLQTGAKITTVLGTGRFDPIVDKNGFLNRAIIVDKGHPRTLSIPINGKARKLLLLHGTTMEGVFFTATFYSFHRAPAEILRGSVKYADGHVANFSCVYGDDIGPIKGTWPAGSAGFCHQSVPVAVGEKHTLFAQEWNNRRPEAPIESISFMLGPDSVDNGEVILAALSLVR